MNFRDYKITKDYKHLYYFLKENKFSETYISSLRSKSGYILINGKIANTRAPLKANDILSLCLNTKKSTQIKSNTLSLDVIFEDEFFLVINKPHKLSSSPSRSHYNENLAGAITNYMQQKDTSFVLRMMNRLDFDTAGLIIIAKDVETYSKLKDIKKTYYAICKGKIEKNIEIDTPIETVCKNGINQQKRIISANGKPAKTWVFPLSFNNENTLAKIKIEHGRTHQIRVHMSSINHPLLGDKIYGTVDEKIDHTALICKEISLIHPFTKKHIKLVANWTECFKNSFKNLQTIQL